MERIGNKVPLIYISGWKGNGRESSSYKWLERYFKNTECYAAGGQTAALVRYLIDQNRTVIAARSQKDWTNALGNDAQGSQYIEKCLRHKNPRQMYVSEANLPKDAWNDLVSQFQKKLNLTTS